MEVDSIPTHLVLFRSTSVYITSRIKKEGEAWYVQL